MSLREGSGLGRKAAEAGEAPEGPVGTGVRGRRCKGEHTVEGSGDVLYMRSEQVREADGLQGPGAHKCQVGSIAVLQ